MAKDVVVDAQDLQKYFDVTQRMILGRKVIGRVHAVDHIDFKVYRGETLGLVGESGCGKTTAARTVLGLTPASGGHVYYNGEDLLEIWNSQKACWYRNKQFARKECQQCENFRICNGACPIYWRELGYQELESHESIRFEEEPVEHVSSEC